MSTFLSDQSPYYVAFSHFTGIGPYHFKKLLSIFKTPKHAYSASTKKLTPILGKSLTEKLNTFRAKNTPDSILENVLKKCIQTITQDHPDYPSQFKNLPDSPICLYLRGNPKVLSTSPNKYFSIVGTRKSSSYGKYLAQSFAETLAVNNFIIVSGMAIGIDAQAHIAALSVQKPTIAILGCGVDIIYPPQNKQLYERIIRNGAVISEFPPGMQTQKGLFIARNRLISGLSRGVLVVEGSKRSGTLITAKYPLEQGKDVFAPPHNTTAPQSYAPHLLIKNGAHLAIDPEDILLEYGMNLLSTQPNKIPNLSSKEKVIFDLLKSRPTHPDKLSHTLSEPISTILTTLTQLEISGLIAKNEQGEYYIGTL